MLLALAALVVLFTVTWIQMPTRQLQAISPPASWFARALTEHRAGSVSECPSFNPCTVDVVEKAAIERRVKFGFAGAAVVIVLVGVAFGAWPRRTDPAG
jgi:hypothetical protein